MTPYDDFDVWAAKAVPGTCARCGNPFALVFTYVTGTTLCYTCRNDAVSLSVSYDTRVILHAISVQFYATRKPKSLAPKKTRAPKKITLDPMHPVSRRK